MLFWGCEWGRTFNNICVDKRVWRGGGVKYYLRGLELISLATVKKYDFKQVHGVFLKFRIVPSE